MLKAHLRVDDRVAIKARSGAHRERRAQPATAALAAGWAAADVEPLAGRDCAVVSDPFDNRVELQRPGYVNRRGWNPPAT